jgi:hypothetical protein
VVIIILLFRCYYEIETKIACVDRGRVEGGEEF